MYGVRRDDSAASIDGLFAKYHTTCSQSLGIRFMSAEILLRRSMEYIQYLVYTTRKLCCGLLLCMYVHCSRFIPILFPRIPVALDQA